VGLHIETADILAVEDLSQSFGGEHVRADVLALDRSYFSEQVRGILAQDCFQEFFYMGQDAGTHEIQGNREGFNN
jgi:hypothetical protein